MKRCSSPMCDVCPGNGTYEHDAIGSRIEEAPIARQIPVYADRVDKQQIGWAEIQQDGSVTIAIQPGELGKNVDVRFVEQIEGFFVSYQYRMGKPGMMIRIPE